MNENEFGGCSIRDNCPTKLCCICSAPLLSDSANYCNKCKKYQSPFLRGLSMIGTSSVLTAIPMFIVFFAYISEKVESKTSKIELAPTSCTSTAVSFFARNTGNSPGVITDTSTYTISKGEIRLAKGQLSYNSVFNSSFLLEGGSGSLFELQPVTSTGQRTEFPSFEKDDKICEIEISVQIVEFSQSSKQRVFKCGC